MWHTRFPDLPLLITSKDIVEKSIRAAQTSLSEQLAQAEPEQLKMKLQHKVLVTKKELSKFNTNYKHLNPKL